MGVLIVEVYQLFMGYTYHPRRFGDYVGQFSKLDCAKKLLRARIQAEEHSAWVNRWYEIVKVTEKGSALVEGRPIFDFIATNSDARYFSSTGAK